MKKTIAVFFGGRSAEHDVSIITAHNPIIESLLATGQYEVWPIYITREGSWYTDLAMNDLSFFQQDDYLEKVHRLKKVRLLFDDGLKLIVPGLLRERVISVDIAFPAMHGTYGEDGSLMGLLRMANVPFVGCDLFASAVAMDKVLTKQVLFAEGINIVPFVWFHKSQWLKDPSDCEARAAELSWPLFVKPVHMGSSIAITRVKNRDELHNALEVAFHYDDKVLVEEGVKNLIEVTLPIMGNDEIRLALPERPLNQGEFFDFSEKYLGGGKASAGVNSEYSEIPANLEPGIEAKVKEFGLKAYKSLGCTGTARIDFLIDDAAKKVFVNEINTLPGSLYHHNWKKSGVSSVELVTRLITLAEERSAASSQTVFAFASDILKKAGGNKTRSASN